jgi:hypothetical protein
MFNSKLKCCYRTHRVAVPNPYRTNVELHSTVLSCSTASNVELHSTVLSCSTASNVELHSTVRSAVPRPMSSYTQQCFHAVPRLMSSYTRQCVLLYQVQCRETLDSAFHCSRSIVELHSTVRSAVPGPMSSSNRQLLYSGVFRYRHPVLL